MELLLLSSGETGGEPGRVLGAHVTHVLYIAEMRKSKQTTNKNRNDNKCGIHR